MSNKIEVKPDKFRLVKLLKEVNDGKLKIPIFQREFEWEKKQMLDLFDSLKQGYPIGSLLLWEPLTQIRNFAKIGPYKIKSEKQDYSYILDGFQRVSTLFGVLTNPKNFNGEIEESELNDFSFFYDLKDEEFVPYTKSNAQKFHLIPLHVLIDTFSLLTYVDDLRYNIEDENESHLYITRARVLATTLIDYEISYLQIKGGDIQSAVDIFSRVNSKGTKISMDWMVSALSYVKGSFLLADEISKLLNELEKYNYGELKRDTIIHCIKTASGKPYFDVNVENLARKPSFPLLSKNTFDNIKKAIEFLYKECKIIDYKLLPYDTQLIFITEFFRLKEPNKKDIEELKKWIWKTSYANYFTIYSLSKQRKAFKNFKEYIEGKVDNIFYVSNLNEEFLTSSFPKDYRINFGSVRVKSILLFMLNRYYDCNKELNNGSNEYNTGQLQLNYINPTQKVIGNLVIKEEIIDMSRLQNRSKDLIDDILDATLINNTSEQFFISKEIIDCFTSNEIEKGIELRIDLIKKQEKIFVEKLGITYNN